MAYSALRRSCSERRVRQTQRIVQQAAVMETQKGHRHRYNAMSCGMVQSNWPPLSQIWHISGPEFALAAVELDILEQLHPPLL